MTESLTFWKDFLKRSCKKQLAELNRDQTKRSIVIDYKELEKAGKEGLKAADDFLISPGAVMENIWDSIVSAELVRRERQTPKINIRFVNFPRKVRIRDIRREDVDRYASIEGVITTSSEVRPRLTEAVFRCKAGHFTQRGQKFGRFSEPDSCDTCNLKKLELIPKRSVFIDSQTGRIRENLESQRAGEQPQQLHFDIEDDLCGQIIGGERVILNGIIRSRQITARGEKTGIFELFLQVNSIEHEQRNFGEVEISPEEEEEIKRISKSPDLLTIVSQSILPAISGLTDEKKGMVLFLFAPHQETIQEKRMRGSLHVMMAGDPGISKSTLLLMLQAITPRSIYISGKSMSAAGLTFTMRQDEHDRRWVADAGAAVLADDSCLFFDELAQAEKPDIMALNEFMETQIIPIAKAGINGILNARCGVMTALNPKFGRFDMSGPPLADQIDAKIPPQLFSRFDLIYLIPDVPEEKRDKEEAENILGLWQGKTVQTKDQIPLPLLQKYIAMARRKKNPKMNDAALRMIVDMYVSVRKSSNGGTISITKRALESLARLATAHAIMRLANEVTIQDAEMAIKVYEYSLKQWAVDPRTQTYDSDRATGKTKDKRNLMEEVQTIIRNQGGRCAPDVIKKEIHSKYLDVTDQQIDKLIEQMYRENIIMEAGLGKFRVV